MYPNVCAPILMKPLFVFLLIIEMVKMGDVINFKKKVYKERKDIKVWQNDGTVLISVWEANNVLEHDATLFICRY